MGGLATLLQFATPHVVILVKGKKQMIISHKKTDVHPQLNVEQLPTGIKVSCLLDSDPVSITVNNDEYTGMQNLYYSPDSLVLLSGDLNVADKSGFYNQLWVHRTDKSKHLGSFFFDTTGVAHFAACRSINNGASFIADSELKGKKTEDYFRKYLPEDSGFAIWDKHHWAKADCVSGISINDSLAMLECQLDLLTICFVKKEKGEDYSAELSLLTESVSSSLVTTLSEDSVILNNIKSTKAKIREIQSKYFEER